MQKIPVLSIVGYSGSGKTTFLEKLILELKKQKIRVAVLKHDAHEFEIDKPGKDSWRFTKAGAAVTGLISDGQAVLMENRAASPEELIEKITNVDVILTEGYKTGKWRKILIHRKAAGKPLAVEPEECLTVVSDVEIAGIEKTEAGRQYGLEDAAGVADLILVEIENWKAENEEKDRTDGALTGEKISLEHARELFTAQGKPLETEKVSVFEAVGRILAEDIYAPMSQPPFARSAMDGFAVRSEDIKGASQENPVRLKLTGRIYAGMRIEFGIEPGEAVRIMTGAMVPCGADCVIRQEDTDWSGQKRGDENQQGIAIEKEKETHKKEEIKIYKDGFSGENICPVGEDFQKGELLAFKGRKIDAYLAASAVAAGVKEILVYRRVRACVITTGDELKQPGEVLAPGEIYDSNRIYVTARLKELGCEISSVCGALDKTENISEAVREAAKQADLVLTTGGVSVGEKDLLPEVMERLGAELLFHGISIKPGMPTMLSLVEGVPVLSLSGNPYSAAAMFELLVPPFLENLTGREEIERTADKGKIAGLANDFLKDSPIRRILRGYYDGKQVFVSEKQGNGQLKGGIGCNCLIDIPAGSGELRAGDEVKIILRRS